MDHTKLMKFVACNLLLCGLFLGEIDTYAVEQKAVLQRDGEIMTEAEFIQKIKKQIMDDMVELLPNDIEQLLLQINELYQQQGFADSASEKDIICYIASKYKGRTEYDSYDLAQFRPDCGKITDAMFTKYKETARKKRIMGRMYSVIDNMMSSGKSDDIESLLSLIQMIYRNSGIPKLQEFADVVSEKDIVCYIASKYKEKSKYDFYDLAELRLNCDKMTDAMFTQYKETANLKRKLRFMYSVIDQEMSSDKSDDIERLLFMVQDRYRYSGNPKLQEFADAVSEKDIVCYIASKYKEKSKYDFYDLAEFRPNCDQVTDAQFNKLKDKAKKRRTLFKSVKDLLEFCTAYNFCPCVSDLTRTSNASEEDVRAVIRSVWKKPSYCGNRGCCFTI